MLQYTPAHPRVQSQYSLNSEIVALNKTKILFKRLPNETETFYNAKYKTRLALWLEMRTCWFKSYIVVFLNV